MTKLIQWAEKSCHSVSQHETCKVQWTMCDVFCKELRGWCRSFTRTELLLALLEFLLLILFIGGVVFLILHLLTCNQKFDNDIVTTKSSLNTKVTVSTLNTKTTERKACTWEPSKKTKAVTHYYEQNKHHKISTNSLAAQSTTGASSIEDALLHYDSDGDEADSLERNSVLALVKIKPPADIIFGCIVTIVSKQWALTAASCVEAIEEVDSLDSFVMMERYGEAKPGRNHAVADVRLHPLYQGVNRSYDLAALKSDGQLSLALHGLTFRLPEPMDYLSTTLGESLIILGFGGFRSVDRSRGGTSVRAARVHRVGARQCARGEWAARHLWAGRRAQADPGAACGGAAPLCAAALWSRGTPCHYCAGAPLLAARGRTLLALMADNPQCGAACEAAAYVNLAALRDWIDAVIDD